MLANKRNFNSQMALNLQIQNYQCLSRKVKRDIRPNTELQITDHQQKSKLIH